MVDSGPWWKNKFVIAGAGVVLVAVGYSWLGGDDTSAGSALQLQPAAAALQPLDARPPRNTTEAVGNDLEALRQLSQAYGLTVEQERAIREIIESANYSP